ncbi:unnamed protein product [Urochloa humidicola]
MATTLAASFATTTAGGLANTTSETIIGSYVFKIKSFSRTKDLGIGDSIRSSPFRVGGHGWYIECYPCGDDEECDGWVTLYLCLDHPGPTDNVEAECVLTLMDYNDAQDPFGRIVEKSKRTYNSADESFGRYFIEREKLEGCGFFAHRGR